MQRYQYDRDVEFNLFTTVLPTENVFQKRNTVYIKRNEKNMFDPFSNRASMDKNAIKNLNSSKDEKDNSGLKNLLRVIGVN